MSVRIRAATQADVAELVRLNGEVQGLHHAARPDDFKPSGDRHVAAWLESALGDPDVATWIAEDEHGRPIGYALLMLHERPETPFCPVRRICELDQIAVAAAHRRRGVGRALIEHALAEARRRGYPAVELNVWAFNEVARAMFERLGFAPQRLTLETELSPVARPPGAAPERG